MPFTDVNISEDIKLRIFFDAIYWSEGTYSAVHTLTRMDGYDLIVTSTSGPEIFSDFSTHLLGNGRAPEQVTGILYSSASGRYHFLITHW